MNSPKDALEEAQDFLAEQDLVATFADPDPTRLRETIEVIKAAIPVAELEGQAVELLRENPNRAIPGKPPLDWFNRRDALLAKLEALKCKSQK